MTEDRVTTWRGRAIDEMSAEELRDALREAGGMLRAGFERERNTFEAWAEEIRLRPKPIPGLEIWHAGVTLNDENEWVTPSNTR